jgi:thymidylate synthase (FAD)
MRETEPQVFLIAEPKINWDEVERYLSQVRLERDDGSVIDGTVWIDRVTDAGISDAEALCEFAGRGCYRSWAPELNANVGKVREDSGEYLDNILKSKHGAVLEHAQWTFHFHDVSRVFTHELVRHRAGVAISQESLRYVRLTDLGFRVPPILADGPEMPGPPDEFNAGLAGSKVSMNDAVISIVERLEEFQRDAAEAFGLDDEGVPFHYKKEVTSALRRLAPIGLSTGMTWSANVRTLRHVIAQRTANGAEEEIRLVFHKVCELMRDRCPLLFGDFEPRWVTVDGRDTYQIGGPSHVDVDPTPYWRPKYEKV